MKKHIYTLLILSVAFINSIFAQGEAAVPFLVLQQSPQFIGAAQVGVAVPPIDPMGFYLNPAVLGETSKEFNFTTLFLPSKVDWFNMGRSTFNTFGLSLGYNFKNSLLNIPLSVGVGFINNKFDFGQFVVTSSESPAPLWTTKAYDEFSSFSLGIGYEYFITLSAGISIKNFTDDMGDRLIDGKRKSVKVDGTAIDYGFLLSVPISKLFYDGMKFNLKEGFNIKPKTNVTLGYSLTNSGDELVFPLFPDQVDPLPRTARFGYNITLGFDLVNDDFKFNLLDYYFIVEAEDILINRNEENNYRIEYQSGFGDMKLGKQLINLEGDEKVVLRKAHMFRFLETVTYSIGRFEGRGYHDIRKTNGLTISTTGLSKYLASNFDNETIQYMANHISIEYYNSTLFVDGPETDFEGIGIILKNFSF